MRKVRAASSQGVCTPFKPGCRTRCSGYQLASLLLHCSISSRGGRVSAPAAASGTSQASRKNCQSSSVSSLGDVSSQNLLEEKKLSASSRNGWLGLFSVKLVSLPGPESLRFPFWCGTGSLSCSLCNLFCLCRRGNLRLRGIFFTSIPIHFAKKSVV